MKIGGKSVTIQLWDTAGQERFGTITKSCYRGCNAVLLVYDVCNRKSFQDITKWVHEINMVSDVRVLNGEWAKKAL